MWTVLWWRDAAERALATAAQSLLAAWGVGDGLLNAWELDPMTGAGIAAGGALLSLLKALAATQVGDPDSASLSPRLAVIERDQR